MLTEMVGQWIPKPKDYGVLDLTSGYCQAPLDPESWYYTAFRCVVGIFVWTRVPMGLKGAPAFQAALTTLVLVGLICHICERYIDNIYERTEKEFCERLRMVLEHCRKHNITFDPKKVILAVRQVEYLGQILDSTGVIFSRETISEVADFPVPTNVKMVVSTFGLCNFFRDHVKEHSLIDAEI